MGILCRGRPKALPKTPQIACQTGDGLMGDADGAEQAGHRGDRGICGRRRARAGAVVRPTCSGHNATSACSTAVWRALIDMGPIRFPVDRPGAGGGLDLRGPVGPMRHYGRPGEGLSSRGMRSRKRSAARKRADFPQGPSSRPPQRHQPRSLPSSRPPKPNTVGGIDCWFR